MTMLTSRLRRSASLVTLIVVALAACGGDVLAPPMPAGAYRLVAVNDSALPADAGLLHISPTQADSGGISADCRAQFQSGDLALTPKNGTFLLHWRVGNSCNDVTLLVFEFEGTYTQAGTSVVFTTPMDGIAKQFTGVMDGTKIRIDVSGVTLSLVADP